MIRVQVQVKGISVSIFGVGPPTACPGFRSSYAVSVQFVTVKAYNIIII